MSLEAKCRALLQVRRIYTCFVTSPYFEPARQALHDHLFGLPLNREQVLYRYEHCLRVAHIGRVVAEREGMDPDILELACLLHDIGKFNATVPVDHGRSGAILARPILEELGLEETRITEICQGIAMHTDGKWNYDPESPDFPGHDLFDHAPSLLARSVGDCDNVDRYSLLRIHGTMNWVRFSEKTATEALIWIDEYQTILAREREYLCSTQSAQELWTRSLDDHEEYFTRLAEQLRPGVSRSR